MRHTESGLAIHDFPLSFGHLIPPVDDASLRKINFERMQLSLPLVTPDKVMIHFAHRVGAGVVCIFLVIASVTVLKRHRDMGELLFPVILLLAMITLQVILGALTIWSQKQPHITTAHVAMGAASLAVSVILTIQSFRLVHAPAQATKHSTEAVRTGEAAT